MNKAELIDAIAAETQLTKADAGRAFGRICKCNNKSA
jgi:nucleoid DNA-binding protein